MIGEVTAIENTCIDKRIEFCGENACSWLGVNTFDWRSVNRSNQKFQSTGFNGGTSTCSTDDIKVVQLGFIIAIANHKRRACVRKSLEDILSVYDCCDDCCPLRVEFTDDDGQKYYFTAKPWSNSVSDTVDNMKIQHQYDMSLEVCDNTFYNEEQYECCWVLGSMWGHRKPKVCDDRGICTIGQKWFYYEGNMCGDYSVSIQAEGLVNPVWYNLSKNKYYGLNGTYSGEINIDTINGVTVNGNDISPLERKTGSSLTWVWFTPWENEMLLVAEWGTATWCLTYWNNRT